MPLIAEQRQEPVIPARLRIVSGHGSLLRRGRPTSPRESRIFRDEFVPDHPWASRLGESSALFVSALLFAGLRNRYTLGPPALTTSLGLVLAATFILSLVWTIARDHRRRRTTTTVGMLVLAAAVLLSLCKVVYLVVYQAATIDGIRLFESSLTIWINNIIMFAICYHLIGDREFSFPRPDDQPSDQPQNFLDYVFLSFTAATAFSPTDMSPLTTRARMLMMVEALVSLVTLAIVAARAINILPQ